MKMFLKDNEKRIEIHRENGMFLFIQNAIEKLFGRSVEGKKVICEMLGYYMDDKEIALSSDSKINVRVFERESVIFERSISVEELVKLSVNGYQSTVLSRRIDTADSLKPKVVGEFLVSPQNNTPQKFRINELTDIDFASMSLSDFNINPLEHQAHSRLKVLITKEVYIDLIESKQYSTRIEEGGFLIGEVYCENDLPSANIIKITDYREAKHVGATLTELIFTGESFSELKKLLSSVPMMGKKLLGWYHTHLFPSGKEIMGLSSVDLNMHFTTFRFPWQVAGLINIERDKSNYLRFYTKKHKAFNMELVPFWII